MIVEDDFLVSLQMESALTEAGFEIVGVASSAEKALEVGEMHRPALAVMDVQLVGRRDGIDVAVELFEKHNIRCIFATAQQHDAVRKRAEPAKPMAWLPKPYTMASLIEAIRAALQQLRAERTDPSN